MGAPFPIALSFGAAAQPNYAPFPVIVASGAFIGTVILVAGTATIPSTAIKSTSNVQLTVQSLGTVTAPQAVGVTARTAGTSFTITSASATDTSVVSYVVIP